MESIVLELQRELLEEGCKVSHVLRKAHVIASKLNLSDFDSWIQNELNGYKCSGNELPEYRKVFGKLFAFNPSNGWIPVVIGNSKIESSICTMPFSHSIGEIEEMYSNNSAGSLYFSFKGESDERLQRMIKMPTPLPLYLHVSPHLVYGIINTVKNCLIEWTLRLEREGIMGEDMTFNLDEQNSAKDIPQQINNYFGTVINGSVNQSQVVTGNNNDLSFSYGVVDKVLEDIKTSIENEEISSDDKEEAIALVDDISEKVQQKKSPKVLKAAFKTLAEFVLSTGANVTASLITDKIQGLF